MNIQINSCKLVLELTDTETGEIITREATLGDFKEVTKKTTSTRTRKPKDDGESDPMIHVLDNKLQFNNKALELTGFVADDKVLVQFEKKGRVVTPVICLNDKGNRMTKTGTVSFRGQQHDTIIEYGENFKVEPYPDKDGYFKLKGDIEKEDDIVDIPEEISVEEEDNIEEDIVDAENFELDF